MKDSVSYIAGNTEVYIIYALYKDFFKRSNSMSLLPTESSEPVSALRDFLLTAGESSR